MYNDFMPPQLDKKIDALAEAVKKGFDAMNERFDEVDKRLDRIEFAVN